MTDLALEPIDTAQPIEHTAERTSPATLAERLSSLRRKTGFTVTDRTLLTAGSILMPLGLVLVILGWYGAAHTTRVFEQIPYMVSGGLAGIVLVVAGGFCYFGFFLARLLATSREMLDSMLRLEERFESMALASPASADRAVRPVADVFVATKNGAMYHRPECPTVSSKAPAELHRVKERDALTPCRICIPSPS